MLRPRYRLRLAAYVALAWLVAMVAAAGLIAPSGHGSILYVVLGLGIGVLAAIVHAVAILLVRGRLPASNTGSLLVAAVGMGPFAVTAEADDRSFLKFLAVTLLIASQLVYWIVVRPLAKRVAMQSRDRQAG